MRAFSAIALGAVIAACAPGPVVVEVPFEAADESAVIAVEHRGGTDVWAVDPATRRMQPILQSIEGWDGAARIEVHAIFYGEPLDALGLAPGRVVSVPEGGAPLPEGARTLSVALEDGAPPRWTPAPRRPPALDDVRLPVDTPCRRFLVDPEWLRYPETFAVLGLVQDAEGRPWVVRATRADDAPALDRLDVRGAVVESVEPDLGEGFRARAADQGPGGEVWLAGGRFGDGLAIYAGAPGGAFREVVRREARLSSLWPRDLAVAGEGEDAVYYLTGQGHLHRFAEGVDVDLFALPERGSETVFRGSLAWAGPEQVFAVAPRGDQIYRIDEEEATLEVTAADADLSSDNDRVQTVGVVPGLGAFAGLDSGVLLERGPERWAVIEQNLLVESSLEAVVPFEGGMLVAGRYGIVDQFYRGVGYCAAERVFVGSATIEFVLVLSEGILVAGTEPVPGGVNPWFVTWLRPSP